MTQEEETKVNFSLWYVLGFIVLLFSVVASYLNGESQGVKATVQINGQRISRLEEQNAYIIKALDKLMVVVDSVDDKVTAHLINGRLRPAVDK